MSTISDISPFLNPNALAVLVTDESSGESIQRRTADSNLDHAQKRYAKLLDSLACLCLHGEKNCVVAVAATNLPGRVELYVAENGGNPSTLDRIVDHLDHIIASVRKLKDEVTLVGTQSLSALHIVKIIKSNAVAFGTFDTFVQDVLKFSWPKFCKRFKKQLVPFYAFMNVFNTPSDPNYLSAHNLAQQYSLDTGDDRLLLDNIYFHITSMETFITNTPSARDLAQTSKGLYLFYIQFSQMLFEWEKAAEPNRWTFLERCTMCIREFTKGGIKFDMARWISKITSFQASIIRVVGIIGSHRLKPFLEHEVNIVSVPGRCDQLGQNWDGCRCMNRYPPLSLYLRALQHCRTDPNPYLRLPLLLSLWTPMRLNGQEGQSRISLCDFTLTRSKVIQRKGMLCHRTPRSIATGHLTFIACARCLRISSINQRSRMQSHISDVRNQHVPCVNSTSRLLTKLPVGISAYAVVMAR
ncbi:hypothetical protein C8Q75DRAFT_491597 [Abortiporus biennis]|nr:hypothetical protein C8Q75DRAFT_491597 [Abortiporus biennis]